jgi:hypothetical protein
MSLSSSQLLLSFRIPVNGVFEGQDLLTYDKMMVRDVTLLRHLCPGSEARVWAFHMLSQCCKPITITTAMTIPKPGQQSIETTPASPRCKVIYGSIRNWQLSSAHVSWHKSSSETAHISNLTNSARCIVLGIGQGSACRLHVLRWLQDEFEGQRSVNEWMRSVRRI